MKQNKIYTLKNGLKIVFYQDTTKHSAYAELIVKYGAINNEFIIDNKKHHINDGMAHFIEHLLIEHSMYGDSSEYFKNNYVNSNGLTSPRYTRYYIKTVENFSDHLEKLIKIVNIPSFTKEDIEITKPPIYEEIRRSKDNKFKDLYFLELKCLFKNMNFGTTLGEEEDIKKINYDDVMLCYNTFYQPQNQVLAIAGNVDIDKTIELVEKIYDEIDKKKVEYVIPEIKEIDEVIKKEDSIYKDVEEDFIRISYKINISSLTPYERVKLTFYIDSFLKYNFNETSNAYKKLVDDKISVNNIGYSFCVVQDYLIISMDTYTSKKNEFINLIQNTISKKETNFEDFLIRKKKCLIDLILREENFMSMINPFIDNILSHNYYEIDKIEDIENETYEDFISAINSLNFDNYCIIKMLKNNEKK